MRWAARREDLSASGMMMYKKKPVTTSAGNVTYEPHVFHCRFSLALQPVSRSGREHNKILQYEAQGDVIVCGLWKMGKSCVLDVCVLDTDAKSD